MAREAIGTSNGRSVAGSHPPVLLERLTERQVSRYLRLLGVKFQRPDRATLDELVRAQLTRVPFENISKLHHLHTLGLRTIPDIDLYLDGMERFRFGGTCYSNNAHFCRLLQTLGFEASLCGAEMPSGRDVHCAIVVRIGERDLLIDAGYAAPFLDPIPLDADGEIVVAFGRDRYVLSRRDEEGRSRLDLIREGKALHGYLLYPVPRPVEHFDRIVFDSFRAEATFMNAVMLVRYTGSTAVTIHNLSLIRSTAGSFRIEQFDGPEQLVAAIESEFGIPAAISSAAIARIETMGDPYQ